MKKVLIVTYYWPPNGGGGVQRWLKFTKYLPEYGWHPIVYTPRNPHIYNRDDSLSNDIGSQLTIIKRSIWEPFFLLGKHSGKIKQGQILESKKNSVFKRIIIWLRGNLLIPDTRVFWVWPSYKFLKNYIKRNDIEAIITTGPPHSIHLIGLLLKRKTKKKWIVDFRDPWYEWDLLSKMKVCGLVMKIHGYFEKKVIKNADRIITVSSTWANQFTIRYGKNVSVITNGFDEEDVLFKKNDEQKKKFVISHVGMLSEMRNPRNLWYALDELCAEYPYFESRLELLMVGVQSETVLKSIRGLHKLSNKLITKSYIPHDEVKQVYSDSNVLLLIQNRSKNAKGHLPGKLFEYFAARKPVLAIGEKDSDMAHILKEANSGFMVDFDDKESIKTRLMDIYHKSNLTFEESVIGEYTRRNLTSSLSALLDATTN